MQQFKLIAFLFFCLLAFAKNANAQATLSVQGSLQNFNGTAVDNGVYDITFKLYTTDNGGTAIWSEVQSVSVVSGVYSVHLGEVNPLDVSFDQTYYLGLTIPGGPEHTPRARMTASPYALSLIGQSNIFPSTGGIGAGTATPTAGYQLHVNNASGDGKLLVEGSNQAAIDFKKGASTQSLAYNGAKLTTPGILNANALEAVNVTATGTVTGNAVVTSSDFNLPAGKTLKYNNLSDWRLVDVDDFSTDAEGWACQEAWQNTTARTVSRYSPNNAFSKGYIISPGQNGDDALFKQFDLSAHPHTQVKLVFTFHQIDSWSPGEFGYGLFSTANPPASGTQNGNFQVAWRNVMDIDPGIFGNSGYTGTGFDDRQLRAEMMAQTDLNTFYVMFCTTLNEVGSNENFGISNVEVWVK